MQPVDLLCRGAVNSLAGPQYQSARLISATAAPSGRTANSRHGSYLIALEIVARGGMAT
jgi:hypothetical protein